MVGTESPSGMHSGKILTVYGRNSKGVPTYRTRFQSNLVMVSTVILPSVRHHSLLLWILVPLAYEMVLTLAFHPPFHS